MPNLSHGLDPLMQEVARKFDDICRSLGALYTIEHDTHNEQGYLIHNFKDVNNIATAMEDFIADKWVRMEINEGDGPYFKFTVKALYEYDEPVQMVDVDKIAEVNALETVSESDAAKWVTAIVAGQVIPPIVVSPTNKILEGAEIAKALLKVGGMNGKMPVIYEEQRKSPNRHYSRRQAQFRSSFGPLRVFGRVVECNVGDKMKLVEPLTAYDNVTIIPKGTLVEIVDNDPRLPDIKYDGQIINVSMEKLMKATGNSKFSKRLEEAVISIVPAEVMTFADRRAVPADDMEMDHEHEHGDHEHHNEDHDMHNNDANNLTHENPIVNALNGLRAAEIVATLQYEIYAILVPSLHMQGLETLFEEHGDEERKHAKKLAQRIHELDGVPVAHPIDIAKLSPYEISYDTTAEGMVATLLEQERIGVESYRKAIDLCAKDPATRLLLEEILQDEEEHTTDMKSMLEDN